MVKTESIKYDVERVTKRAYEEKKWTVQEWALQAGVSEYTLRKFIYGDPNVKFSTASSIVKPLGFTAMELIQVNSGKKKA